MLQFKLLILFIECVLPLLFISLASTVNGIDAGWSTALFPVKEHNFGSVAVGAKAVRRFEFTNPYKDDIQLISVSTSCGCTSAAFSTKTVKSGETAAVIATFNTSGQFRGERYAAVTVRLRREGYGTETVLLSVEGVIRSDIVLKPGSIEFGSVPQGKTAVRMLQLEYTGRRTGWALTDIGRSLPFIDAKAEEERRSLGSVVYRITATVQDDAPAGYVKDVLRFGTNEISTATVYVSVQGVVTAPVIVKPQSLLMNAAADEEYVAKNIVLRSEMPFLIKNVQTAGKELSFTFSRQESKIQMITVMYQSGGGQCKYYDVQLTRDSNQVTVELKAYE
ncbi:MAG: DUF1573 domain-containing protein [Planctomycetaceae bacterium]|jgi:hypothetical protein|nr:DUF1573 domain-containing protein [Planctomycetaceae bacterium]